MFHHWTIVVVSAVVFLSAIGGLTLSAVAISHGMMVRNYQNSTCSLLVNTPITKQSSGSYSCSGYTNMVTKPLDYTVVPTDPITHKDFPYTTTIPLYDLPVTNIAKLTYPVYDPILYGVSEQDCQNWIETYSNVTTFTCYIQNPTEKCTNGYVILPALTKFYVIIAISCVVIFTMFIIGLVLFLRFARVILHCCTNNNAVSA